MIDDDRHPDAERFRDIEQAHGAAEYNERTQTLAALLAAGLDTAADLVAKLPWSDGSAPDQEQLRQTLAKQRELSEERQRHSRKADET